MSVFFKSVLCVLCVYVVISLNNMLDVFFSEEKTVVRKLRLQQYTRQFKAGLWK